MAEKEQGYTRRDVLGKFVNKGLKVGGIALVGFGLRGIAEVAMRDSRIVNQESARPVTPSSTESNCPEKPLTPQEADGEYMANSVFIAEGGVIYAVGRLGPTAQRLIGRYLFGER